MSAGVVAAGFSEPRYNPVPPFHPGSRYPELPFDDVAADPNPPYAELRRLFVALGYDAERFGTPAWNPLRGLIQPGQTVVIKPNFVLGRNRSGGDVFAVVTHPSVLRALVDYAYLALGGEGRILIADVPQMDCQWAELMAAQRLDAVQSFYRERLGFGLDVMDLRSFELIDPDEPAYSDNRRALPGDPLGSVVVNLGRRSEFYGLPSENYYGADYDRAETVRHHHGETHEYCVSRTILSADVVISAPKLKVHKKVGVTLNLKGLVGINTNKNYLVHYRVGTPSRGGDQLPDATGRWDRAVVAVQRWMWDHALARQTRLGDLAYRAGTAVYRTAVKPFRRVSRETAEQDGGNWHGNDSAWRMTADLAKILYFADADGRMHDTPQRRLLCVVDGVVGGEGLGPLAPDPVPAGCLVAGENPFAVDMAATRLMGLDPARVPQFRVAFGGGWDFGLRSPGDVELRTTSGAVVGGGELFTPEWRSPVPPFRPHPGWVGHLEAAPR